MGNFESKALGHGCQVLFKVLLKFKEPDRATPSCLSLCGTIWLLLTILLLPLTILYFKSMVYLKARDCVNKEVGEGCPGEETQLQHCQERSCPGDKEFLMLVWNPHKSLG